MIYPTIKDWQKYCKKIAVENGFAWKPEEIDTILLRIHGEVDEAAEAMRDEDLEHFGEELADIFIRLADCAETMGVDLEKEVVKKCRKNRGRPKLHGRKRK